MPSARSNLTLSYAVIALGTMTAFATALWIGRRAAAQSDVANQAVAVADDVTGRIAATALSGWPLTHVDSSTDRVFPRVEIMDLLDPLPGYFFVIDRNHRVLYKSQLVRLLPAASQDTLAAYALSLSVGGPAAFIPVNRAGGRTIKIAIAARTRAGLGREIAHVVGGMPDYVGTLPVQMLVGTLIAIAPVVFLLSLVVAYFAVPGVLKPVDDLINDVEAITDGRSLHRRVPDDRGTDELSRLAGTLNAMLSRLEQSFGTLRRFTADASHELKTPLTVLRLNVERAMNPDTGRGERLVALEESLQEVTRMSDLVDSLLTLARADERRLDLVRGAVDLGALLEDVHETAVILGEPAGLSVHMTGVEETVISGDATRLRQLFLNLLTNAIKYTPRGGRVDLTMQKRSDGSVAVSVRDTGIGIPAIDLPHIFDRFWRVDRARSRGSERGGFGLGLAISQWIVQAHGGTLTVQSRVGRGTVFTVSLPPAGPEPETGAEVGDTGPETARAMAESGQDFTKS